MRCFFLLLLVCSQLSFSASGQETSGQEVRAERRLLPGNEFEINPALLDATAELQREFQKLAALDVVVVDADAPRSDSKFRTWAESKLDQFPDEFMSMLRQNGASLTKLAEFHLFQRGAELFADARERDPAITVDDVRKLLDLSWWESEPVVVTEVFREQQELLEAHGEPLSAVSNFGNAAAQYLVFGALHTPDFWETDEQNADTRADLIRHLFELGLRDAIHSKVVLAILQPPLASPDRESNAASEEGAGEKAGRQADGGLNEPPVPLSVALKMSTGGRLPQSPVGYVPAHLEFWAEIVGGMTEYRRGGDRQLFSDRELVHRDGSSATVGPRSTGYLDEYASEMYRRVLAELRPEGASTLREGALPEQQRYWEQLAQQGWAALWGEAEGHVRQLLSGEVPHPSDARIDALLAEFDSDELKKQLDKFRYFGEGTLTAEQQEMARELIELLEGRSGDRHQMSEELMRMFAQSAPADIVRRELVELEGFLLSTEGLGSLSESQVMQGPWRELFSANSDFAVQALQDHYDNATRDETDRMSNSLISVTAREQAVAAIQIQSHLGVSLPGGADALRRVGTEGSDDERFCVLITTNSFNESEARELFDAALDDFSSDHSRRILGGAAVMLLHNRATAVDSRGRLNNSGESPWITEALVNTFREGLWTERLLVGHHNTDSIRWSVNAIPEATYQELVDRQLLPEELKQYRKAP